MPAVVDRTIFRAALEYAGLGLHVVPLYGIDDQGQCECGRDGCASAGKHPRVNAWQAEATDDEEKINAWWERWPGSNVGVALGPLSHIIDIECDSDDAEAELADMCGGEFPETPTYQSRRGKHRLFRLRMDLPFPDKAAWKIGQIDIKTGMGNKGTQSVFPPSRRADGAEYKWVIHPGQVPFADIPERLYAELWNRSTGDAGKPDAPPRNPSSPRQRLYQEPEIIEGGRDETIYAEAVATWGEQLRLYGERCLEDPETMARVYERLWAWDVSKCRPPLGPDVVRQKSESARGFIRGQALAGKASAGVRFAKYGLELKDGEWWPGTWRVVIFSSDPMEYHIVVPDWKELIGGDGRVRVSSNQYLNAGDVAHAIAVATQCVIVDDVPGVWAGIWNGAKGNAKEHRMPTRGLKAKLLDTATREAAQPEERRDVLICSGVVDLLRKAGGKPEDAGRGTPTPHEEGVTCTAAALFRAMENSIRDLKRVEITRLFTKFGIKSRVLRIDGSAYRLYVVENEQLTKMTHFRTGATETDI